MHIVAFVISVFSALLSLLQGGCGTMLAGVGMHISQSLGSAPNRDLASMGAAGVGVLFASMLALAGGGLALGRRRGASVLLLISAALCGMAFLGGFGDAAIWGILYIVAAVFAHLGAQGEQRNQFEPATQPEAQFSDIDPQKQETVQRTLPKMGSGKNSRAEARFPKDNEAIAGLETDALVARAFLFLEDGCFSRADRYLEQALNQDPKNSRAYLGKLMAELNARDEKDLADSLTPLEEHKHYQRALQFADNEEKARLTDYAQAVLKKTEERQEAEREARYAEAVELKARAKGAIIYKQAARLFEELGSYKNSREMAVLCERLAVKKGAQERRQAFFQAFCVVMFLLAAKPAYEYLSRFFAHKSEAEREAPGSLSSSKPNENLSPLPPSSPKAVEPQAEPQAAPQGPETVMALGSREWATSLHERPDSKSPFVGQIPANHIFPIIEARVEEGSRGRWYRISSEKYGRGWISEEDVRLEGEEETISDFIHYGEEEFNSMRREAEEALQSLQRFIAEKKLPGHVIAGGNIYLVRSYGSSLKEIRGNKVNLRREPNTRSEVIMQMNEGYPVDADAYWTRADGRETWYYVRTPDGREGWVFEDFVGDRPR